MTGAEERHHALVGAEAATVARDQRGRTYHGRASVSRTFTGADDRA
jgi:hypothetical protein